MNWTVTKIVGAQKGTDGIYYTLIWLEDDDGKPAKTYVCKGMRNYGAWDDVLVVGAVVTGLRLKEPGLIDADASPRRVQVKTREWTQAEKRELVDAVLPLGSDRPQRKLTHALIYDKRADRWQCACGYTLGDGHDALYALCPMSHRDKAVNAQKRQRGRRVARRSYTEFNITDRPSKAAGDLFDIS